MFDRSHLAALFALLVALAVVPSAASAAPPSNNSYMRATALAPGDVLSGSNIDATSEPSEPTPTEGNPREARCTTVTDSDQCSSSVWYALTVPADGSYTVETCDQGTDVDTIVGVFTGGNPAAAAEVASNDDGDPACAGAANDYGSRVQFTGTAGTTYHVEVTGYDAAEGSFYVRAYPTASPPTDTVDTQIANDHSLPARQIAGLNGEIASGPRASASFDFYSDSGHPRATFECSLDGAAFAACTSPVSYDGLSAGSHSFAVRSVDSGNADPTPAVQRFTVDDTAPDSSLTDGPPSTSSDPTATWQLSSSQRNYLETFRCAIDSQPAGTYCDSYKVTANNFCNGTHQLQFAAIDQAFNIDPTPVTATFEETGGGDCVTPATVDAPVIGSPSATEPRVDVTYDPKGSGGTLRLNYGPTTAYGLHPADQAVGPDAGIRNFYLPLLEPGTEYHVKATLTTPGGVVSSSDVMFTTPTPTDPLPAIALGSPVAVGHHAAAIPLTIDNPGPDKVFYGVQIDSGPLSPASTVIAGDDLVAPTVGTVSRVLDVIDLMPGTYHVRALVENGDDITASPTEASLTVPAIGSGGGSGGGSGSGSGSGSGGAAPGPQTPATPHFILKRSTVKLGKLTRHSKFLTVSLSGLPASSAVTADLSASVKASALKRLAHGRVKANSRGAAKLKVRLSKKARKLLRSRKTKSLTLRITVAPRGQKPTRVTLHPRLKR